MDTPTNPFNDLVFLHATPSDRGSFSLATDKALEKLEKFQLPDPTYFILQWVQAVVASGAERIDISYQTSLPSKFELHLVFDGPGYNRSEVEGIYEHVFRSGRDRSLDRLRELSLGWLSASSLELSEISLESNGVRRSRLGTGRAASETTTVLPPSETGQALHILSVSGKGAQELDKIIRQRCSEATCKLYVNGNAISFADNPGGVPWPNRSFSIGPTRGVMGATYGGSVASQIAFLRYGVEFVSRPEPTLLPPVSLRVSDDTLSKNVSQTDIVRDEAYDEFLTRIRGEMKSMGLQLTKQRIPSYQREALNRFIQSYLKSYIDVRVFDGPERLALMGKEFANLVEFPLFTTTGSSYCSLQALQVEYQTKGYLLYTHDRRAATTKWSGLLLLLEPEEVAVLRRFFSNLTPLSYDDVKLLSRGGMQHYLADATKSIMLEVQDLALTPELSVQVKVNDVYPTGQAVLHKSGLRSGRVLPGIEATLEIVHPAGVELTHGDLARLQQTLHQPVEELVKALCQRLQSPDIGNNQSRPRYAELACELLLFLLSAWKEPSSLEHLVEKLDSTIVTSPMFGLEDGNLVSLQDLFVYLKQVGKVYLGGAFLDGLESGALDPMPRAERLLHKIVTESQIVKTRDIKDRIEADPDLKFQLRRQTLLKGIGTHPSPAQALMSFATEAAQQAELLAQLEQEYRDALKAPKLFVQPAEERLRELAEGLEEEEYIPFNLVETSLRSQSEETGPRPALAATQPLQAPPLPSLEHDLESLRRMLGDFCATPGAIHVECHETGYSFQLSTHWGGPTPNNTIHLLRESEPLSTLCCPLPVEGFLRLGPLAAHPAELILKEALEQLVMKVVHAYKLEPTEAHQRRRLREWLLSACCHLSHWRETNQAIVNDLIQLPLVPCLGERLLSWRQLRRQADRLGHTLVQGPSLKTNECDPLQDVIQWNGESRDSLLGLLGFPRIVEWKPSASGKGNFDHLLRSAWKELSGVLAGTQEGILSHDQVAQMTGGSSFWIKWTQGFLSWDQDGERALVNPDHKLGKLLLKKYESDPGWSAVLACALFSTINRGVEEVEDHHEKAFLMGLLDTLA